MVEEGASHTGPTCGMVVRADPSRQLRLRKSVFWLSGGVLAIGVAVAPLWRFQSSNWYWPTVVVLGLVHLVVLYLERTFVGHRELPQKGLVQGILVVDCMASWTIMVGVCWMANRRFPWQLSDQ